MPVARLIVALAADTRDKVLKQEIHSKAAQDSEVKNQFGLAAKELGD